MGSVYPSRELKSTSICFVVVVVIIVASRFNLVVQSVVGLSVLCQ